ncbi:hypothetical protein VHEMI09873 [[Torrubiella] hemipterigena]|uniref:Uncharacterized protein n=1 Tax=[Torrubiella] hemipterigena TaxID=1531966 RepID=A0A0A1TQV1_9HYPO|nr:hypothetical protein VHEMI09873 [[Torrubiella] hemipterigena]
MPIQKCLKQSLASIRQKTKTLPSCVQNLKEKICKVLMKPTSSKDTAQSDLDSGYGGSADTLCEASYSLPPFQFSDTPTLASAYFSSTAPADGSVQFPRFGEPERGSTPVTYYSRRLMPVTFDEIVAAMVIETARRHQPEIIYASREATRHESSAAMICSTTDATPEHDGQPTEADLLLESRLAAAQQACMQLEEEAIRNGMVDFSLSVLVNHERLDTIGEVVQRQPNIKIGSYRGRERRYTRSTGNLGIDEDCYEDFGSSMSSVFCYPVR